jgi:hypothetical protein
VKKACEPLHVQLDLSNYEVAVVNTTIEAHPDLSVSAKVYSLGNKLLFQHEEKKDSAADSSAEVFRLDLSPLFSNGVLLVKLELHDSGGHVVSDNLYWLAADSAAYRQLTQLPPASLTAAVEVYEQMGRAVHETIKLENKGATAALETKLTVLDSKGARILPAYFTDNYVSLLPGESKEIGVTYDGVPGQLAIRGWNVQAGIGAAKK